MAPERVNLPVVQGDAFRKRFTVLGLSPSTIFRAEIKRWSGGPVMAQFIIEFIPLAGAIDLSLNEFQTAALIRNGWYDLEVVDPTNGPTTYFCGEVIVRPQISTEASAPPPKRAKWSDLPPGLTGENISHDLTGENV